MIILNSKNVIVLHIPKSGGTSVTNFIDRHLAWNDIVIGGTDIGELFHLTWSKRFNVYKHELPSGIERMMGRELYAKYMKVAVCRHPCARFISALRFMLSARDAGEKWFTASTDWDNFVAVRNIEGFIESKYFKDIREKPAALCTQIELMFKPQVVYIDRSAVDRKKYSAFKLEDLMEDVEPLSRMVGINQAGGLPRSNVTTGYEHIVLTETLEDKIRDIYKEDFEFFNY